MTHRSEPTEPGKAQRLVPGTVVVWNAAHWQPGPEDAQGRGYGSGRVIASPAEAEDADDVPVQWPCGRWRHARDHLLPLDADADNARRQRRMPAAIAATALRRGAVIAYPTEGVWGLGCDPSDRDAVMRLLDIKQRDPAKGLILIAAERAQLDPFIDFDALPASRMAALETSWPGPHTWIVPARAGVGSELRGAHAGLAVRVSAHVDVIALCNAFGGALVSTSANLAGQPAPTRHADLDVALLARIDGVMEGETGGAHGPSSIRDALSGQLLRAGA